MEYVLFVCLMIVPVISIAALLLSIMNMKRIDNIKKIISRILNGTRKSNIDEEEREELILDVI